MALIHLRNWLLLALVVALATPSWASAELSGELASRFTYKAFIGGTAAGDVVVDVRRDAAGYRVNGTAATTGFWRSIDDWSGDFSAEGTFTDSAADPEMYVLLESSSRKEQHVVVTGGELFVTKNGKVRKPKPAHPGVDLVSALWVVADCVDSADLHNGRHGYQVQRSQLEDGTCRYEVENDDGDTYSANVRFTEHQGFPVLESLVVNRLVGTRLTLVDVEALATEPEPTVAAALDPAPVSSPETAPDPGPAIDPATDTAM